MFFRGRHDEAYACATSQGTVKKDRIGIEEESRRIVEGSRR